MIAPHVVWRRCSRYLLSYLQSSPKIDGLPLIPSTLSKRQLPIVSNMAPSDRDLEQAIAKDASDFIRELEVERIIRAFKLK